MDRNLHQIQAKIIIKQHPLVSKSKLEDVRERCRTFRSYLKSEGKEIEALEVTWKPDGQFGGLLVHKRRNPLPNLGPSSATLPSSSSSVMDRNYSKENRNPDSTKKGHRPPYSEKKPQGIKLKISTRKN